MNKAIHLLFFIGICYLPAVIGLLFTSSATATWYTTLNKPSFNPPNWIFGPVWTVLYLMMGLALFLIWSNLKKPALKKVALKYFFIQLIFNTLWSVIFFGLKQPLIALFEILGLWVLILITIKYFLNIAKLAAWLLIPYLVWVSLATVLNFFIVLLN